MANLEAGREYKVIARGNLHQGKVVVISEIKPGGVGLAYVGSGPYPFLPGELEAVVPTPSRPKKATPARRAATYKGLLERVLSEWSGMPPGLRAEAEAALRL